MSHATIRLPDQQIELLSAGYRRELAKRRQTTLIGVGILILAILLSGFVAEVKPAVLFANIDKFTSYFARIFYLDNGRLVFTDIQEWFWGFWKWGKQLVDTLLIAYLGTLFGAIFAFLICFSAAINLTPRASIRFLARRYLEFCRTVPEIVFALIFVVAFGLGPVPGVLAITIHTIGALGKLFAEVAENIDMKPVEGVVASGGTRWQAIRYGVLPQVLPNLPATHCSGSRSMSAVPRSWALSAPAVLART